MTRGPGEFSETVLQWDYGELPTATVLATAEIGWAIKEQILLRCPKAAA